MKASSWNLLVDPLCSGYALRQLLSIISPIYWTSAYEIGDAVNGHTLTEGNFERDTQVSFGSGMGHWGIWDIEAFGALGHLGHWGIWDIEAFERHVGTLTRCILNDFQWHKLDNRASLSSDHLSTISQCSAVDYAWNTSSVSGKINQWSTIVNYSPLLELALKGQSTRLCHLEPSYHSCIWSV